MVGLLAYKLCGRHLSNLPGLSPHTGNRRLIRFFGAPVGYETNSEWGYTSNNLSNRASEKFYSNSAGAKTVTPPSTPPLTPSIKSKSGPNSHPNSNASTPNIRRNTSSNSLTSISPLALRRNGVPTPPNEVTTSGTNSDETSSKVNSPVTQRRFSARPSDKYPPP